ncbi:hypothetical protein B1B04_15245 [Lysinibacillus sp. KCTC 33748]|uniref:hypothetical protein n=1 Tax=unclassified Lysinibacillus TaxID=2636778 RepID=UPI0009A6B602|nr:MULTISPECIES: hypothetical protein [unclassified Lysinibacillus]OXS72652.1 hypothetical protein B1B04_15245 [Lysinibacillus sp. KCTC 33748]SKB92205.1 hypothetical protein SAMN06295926_11284 [Lysinibacillus sp. AC-3]
MQKVIVSIGLIILLVGTFVFYNKFYLPPLPIESISKKTVIEKINDSETRMVKLRKENGKEWYVLKGENISTADEMIKEMLDQNGWVFKEKDGRGLFFERHGENLIVTTQMWTGDYVLVDFPADFNE